MSRSAKKGPYVDEKVIKKVEKILVEGGKKYIRTWARAAVVTPKMVGFTFGVHNGKEHKDVFITESMVGHKLGEFAITRKFTGHSKKGKIAKSTGSTGRVAAD